MMLACIHTHRGGDAVLPHARCPNPFCFIACKSDKLDHQKNPKHLQAYMTATCSPTGKLQNPSGKIQRKRFPKKSEQEQKRMEPSLLAKALPGHLHSYLVIF